MIKSFILTSFLVATIVGLSWGFVFLMRVITEGQGMIIAGVLFFIGAWIWIHDESKK